MATTANTTPTNEAGHGLPKLPQTEEFALRAMATNYGEGHRWDSLDQHVCRRAADEIKILRERIIALSRGVPEHPRYFADGPQGCFFADDLKLARELVNLYDKNDDWTITDLSNPTGAAPAAAGAQGEEYQRGYAQGVADTQKSPKYDSTGDTVYTQPAAADAGVRERAQSERHLDGLRISLRLGGVRLLSGPFDSPKAHGEAMRAINDSLSSHRQAGDESKFRELAERWLAEDARRHSAPTELSGCADDLIALVEKGAGNG